ncbi:MAG: GAF domain-containing sensor histidine kinase, partial [Bacteroidota bacterium]
YAEFAIPINLRACWSMPILSKQGKVLGTFAMYYDHVRKPNEEELELLKFVVNLAGITIEKKQLLDKQKKYEAKITSQNEELLKINRELDSFVYRASHDIKAPLASLLGIINLASRNSQPGSDQEVWIKHMRKAVASLDHYVLELIDHSQNLRLENSVDRIDIDALIAEILNNLSYLPEASAVKYNLALKPDAEFYSDQKRLIIILKNLLVNSIQYCSPDRSPQINVTADINPLQASIKVQDNGIGIEQESIPKIFQMFYRAAERSTGSGLGLYIVKETVERLRGQIDVNSQVGVGTTFRIILPNLKQSA